MITLSHTVPLARGLMRYVFPHPDRPDAVIKVIRPDMLEARWGGRRGWLKRRARARQYTVYLRELREYVALRAREPVAAPFVRIFGLVETDLGLGQVVECVRGEDGALAPTLDVLVARHGLADWIREGVDGLFDELLRHRVVLSDMHIGNVVYGHSGDEPLRFVLIDGFGEKNVVPLCSMSERFNTRNTRRLYARLARQMAELAAAKA